MQANLAGRYARALFDLAQENGALAAVEASVARIGEALSQSPAMRTLMGSPVVSRSDAGAAAAAIATELQLDALTSKFLGVLSKNRRLGETANIVTAFAQLTAAQRGETSANVTSAHPLSPAQVADLKTKLKGRLDREVAVNLHVDPAILGGMIVQVGSRQFDSSIRTRLNTLAVAMKG